MPAKSLTSEATPVQIPGANGLAQVFKDTPLAKLNYFDGRYLRAEDLTREQRYHETRAELVALGQGAGPVYGLGIAPADGLGGPLSVSPGLGFNDRGEMVYLTGSVTFDLARLIEARAKLDAKAAATETAAVAAFGECLPVETPAPVAAVNAAQTAYLVTIAPASALCGRLDVYGSLCEAACIQGSAANLVLAGAVLRAYPVLLPLPAVAGATDAHLRSLLAAAWFRREAQGRGALLAEGGLRQPGWCGSAERRDGAEIPLAIALLRHDQWIVLDQWTVRRERMTPLPLGVWQGRMGMRRHEVFLAEVLQFQCQLSDILRGAGVPQPPAPPDRAMDCLELVAALELTEAQKKALAELMAKMPRADAALPAAAAAPGWLFASGIAELPPAGFLPVDPASTQPLRRQIAALLGPDVDFRLLAAPAEVVPHAFEEARDMRRIPLVPDLRQVGEGRPQLEIFVPDAVKKTLPGSDDLRATHAGLHGGQFLGLAMILGMELKTLVDLKLMPLATSGTGALASWMNARASESGVRLALLGTPVLAGEGDRRMVAAPHLMNRDTHLGSGGAALRAEFDLHTGAALVRKAATELEQVAETFPGAVGLRVLCEGGVKPGGARLEFDWSLAMALEELKLRHTSLGRLRLEMKEGREIAVEGAFNGATARAFSGRLEVTARSEPDLGGGAVSGRVERALQARMWLIRDPVLPADSLYLLADLWSREERPLASEHELPSQVAIAALRTDAGYVPQLIRLIGESDMTVDKFLNMMRNEMERPNGLTDTFDRSVQGEAFATMSGRVADLSGKLASEIDAAFRRTQPGQDMLVPSRDWVMFRRSRVVTEIDAPAGRVEPVQPPVVVVADPPKEPDPVEPTPVEPTPVEPVVVADRVWKLGGAVLPKASFAAIAADLRAAEDTVTLEDIAGVLLTGNRLPGLQAPGTLTFAGVELKAGTAVRVMALPEAGAWVAAGQNGAFKRLLAFGSAALLADDEAKKRLGTALSGLKSKLATARHRITAVHLVETPVALAADDALIVLLP